MAVFVNSKELDTQRYVIPDNKTSEPDCVGHWPPIKARMFTLTVGRKVGSFCVPHPTVARASRQRASQSIVLSPKTLHCQTRAFARRSSIGTEEGYFPK